jgi:hypothetical protein
MKKYINIVIIASLIGVIIYLSFKIKTNPVDTGREKALRDSIAYLQKRIDSSHIRQEQLELAYDSVCRLEPQIKHKTREKIKFILTAATPDELDSIIRAAIKREIRYK